jgi:hypothetical protein
VSKALNPELRLLGVVRLLVCLVVPAVWCNPSGTSQHLAMYGCTTLVDAAGLCRIALASVVQLLWASHDLPGVPWVQGVTGISTATS